MVLRRLSQTSSRSILSTGGSSKSKKAEGEQQSQTSNSKPRRWPSFGPRLSIGDGGKRRAKKVTFCRRKNETFPSLTRKDFSDSEEEAYWFGEDELQESVDRCWDIVDMYENRNKNKPFELCTRGLENYFMERQKGQGAHQIRRKHAYTAVLHWGHGLNAEEKARRYQTISKTSLKRALDFGRRDAAIADRILADVAKKYRRKRRSSSSQQKRAKNAPRRTNSQGSGLPRRTKQGNRGNAPVNRKKVDPNLPKFIVVSPDDESNSTDNDAVSLLGFDGVESRRSRQGIKEGTTIVTTNDPIPGLPTTSNASTPRESSSRHEHTVATIQEDDVFHEDEEEIRLNGCEDEKEATTLGAATDVAEVQSGTAANGSQEDDSDDDEDEESTVDLSGHVDQTTLEESESSGFGKMEELASTEADLTEEDIESLDEHAQVDLVTKRVQRIAIKKTRSTA